MIPMANDTATLFMRYGTGWVRAVLRGVVWSQKTVRTISANGTLQLARQTVLIVPAEIVVQVGEVVADYVDPKTYAALSASVEGPPYPAAWTLDKGFVLVRGEVTTDITSEYKISDLKSVSDTYATIQAVTDNTRRKVLKHWQVEAV